MWVTPGRGACSPIHRRYRRGARTSSTQIRWNGGSSAASSARKTSAARRYFSRGTTTIVRSASALITRGASVELERRVAHELLPLVRRVDGARGPRLRAHRHRLRARAVAPVAHALQQIAVADAGGAEEHVVAGDEVVLREHPVEVVAGVERGLALGVVARVQSTEDLAPDALERGGGDDALGGAADAEEDVGAAARGGDGDRAGDVAIGDELDAGARLPALLDDV